MKSILISIKPEWTAKILNGEKTIEVRKTAPKCDLPIEVYIYCTKNDNGLRYWGYHMGGRIFAKFTLNKIDNFVNGMNELEREWYGKPDAEYDYFAYEKALEKACLTYEEADKYCPDQSFYAWHISDLVIFDKPRELSEFMPPKWDKCGVKDENGLYQCNKCPYGDKANIQCKRKPLTRAPQSWCYCEEIYPGATARKIELPKEVEAKPYKKEKR